MAVLYPNFKEIKFLNFETVKVDFNKFSKNQKEFDAEKLKHFLNWRLDMNCVEKPLFEKVQNKYICSASSFSGAFDLQIIPLYPLSPHTHSKYQESFTISE
ncbi:unnamed protein product [Meloidogyne enterolobii]|uniref:Uncharacterized protein n=1 Tax=Meloidogyne enterolobii TaxID=390850 RepID=A0ACB1AAH0_MELEN